MTNKGDKPCRTRVPDRVREVSLQTSLQWRGLRKRLVGRIPSEDRVGGGREMGQIDRDRRKVDCIVSVVHEHPNKGRTDTSTGSLTGLFRSYL